MGKREDVRWLQITDGKGRGMKIIAKNSAAFSALHYSDQALLENTHNFSLIDIKSHKPILFKLHSGRRREFYL